MPQWNNNNAEMPPNSGIVSREYEAGHESNFGKKPDRFCECGYLPAWCQCQKIVCAFCGKAHVVSEVELPGGVKITTCPSIPKDTLVGFAPTMKGEP